MPDSAILTPPPAWNDWPGVILCGVTREGCTGGGPRDCEDGQEILFNRTGVTARRPGSEYPVTRAA